MYGDHILMVQISQLTLSSNCDASYVTFETDQCRRFAGSIADYTHQDIGLLRSDSCLKSAVLFGDVRYAPIGRIDFLKANNQFLAE